MPNIREAVRNIIDERILPWIERDGIANLILPEQITPADCAKHIKCKQPFNIHRENELGIGLTGEAQYCINDKTFIFTPGRMVLLPGNTPHISPQTAGRFSEDLDPRLPSCILWMLIHPFGVRVQVTHATDDADTVEVSWPFLLVDWRFSRLIADLLEEVRTRATNYDRIGRGILIEFMERCLRAAVEAPAFPAGRRSSSSVPSKVKGLAVGRWTSSAPKKVAGSKVKRLVKDRSASLTTGRPVEAEPDQPAGPVQIAQGFIHVNYHTPVTLEGIADVANISANHLGRLFKAATGMTPIQYLMEVRMKAAEQLLLTDLKIFEVAHLVGIEDHRYFSRLFRRRSGITPGRYRRQMAKAAGQPPLP